MLNHGTFRPMVWIQWFESNVFFVWYFRWRLASSLCLNCATSRRMNCCTECRLPGPGWCSIDRGFGPNPPLLSWVRALCHFWKEQKSVSFERFLFLYPMSKWCRFCGHLAVLKRSLFSMASLADAESGGVSSSDAMKSYGELGVTWFVC